MQFFADVLARSMLNRAADESSRTEQREKRELQDLLDSMFVPSAAQADAASSAAHGASGETSHGTVQSKQRQPWTRKEEQELKSFIEEKKHASQADWQELSARLGRSTCSLVSRASTFKQEAPTTETRRSHRHKAGCDESERLEGEEEAQCGLSDGPGRRGVLVRALESLP